MRSFSFCPVSDKKVNERVARINGAFTVALLILSCITESILPVLFLVVDFFLRATDYAKFSLIAISSKRIASYLALDEYYINAGPKLFAARIGFVLCSVFIISFALKAYAVAWSIAGILGLFSFLEAAFGICVACEIYPYVYKFLNK